MWWTALLVRLQVLDPPFSDVVRLEPGTVAGDPPTAGSNHTGRRRRFRARRHGRHFQCVGLPYSHRLILQRSVNNDFLTWFIPRRFQWSMNLSPSSSVLCYLLHLPPAVPRSTVHICFFLQIYFPGVFIALFFCDLMSTVGLVICPIAIAYSMGQIIKSVCICQSVCLSVCEHSHGRISWSIFTKIGTDVRTPKMKNEFVRRQHRTTSSPILSPKLP